VLQIGSSGLFFNSEKGVKFLFTSAGSQPFPNLKGRISFDLCYFSSRFHCHRNDLELRGLRFGALCLAPPPLASAWHCSSRLGVVNTAEKKCYLENEKGCNIVSSIIPEKVLFFRLSRFSSRSTFIESPEARINATR